MSGIQSVSAGKAEESLVPGNGATARVPEASGAAGAASLQSKKVHHLSIVEQCELAFRDYYLADDASRDEKLDSLIEFLAGGADIDTFMAAQLPHIQALQDFCLVLDVPVTNFYGHWNKLFDPHAPDIYPSRLDHKATLAGIVGRFNKLPSQISPDERAFITPGYVKAMEKIELTKQLKAPGIDLSGHGLIICPPGLDECKDATVFMLDFNTKEAILYMQQAKDGSAASKLSDAQLARLGMQRDAGAHNTLVALPPELIKIEENITTISMLGFCGGQVPPRIKNMRNLKGLSMQYCGLKDLPPWLGQLSQVNFLDFTGNELTGIPTELGDMQMLERLTLSGNPLETVPNIIPNFPRLTHLALNQCRLSQLPSINAEKLEWLDISDNPISQIHDDFSTRLKRFEAGNTAFTTMPAGLRKATGLTYLSFANAPLESVPDWLAELIELGMLSFLGTKVTLLPPQLVDKLTKLELLFMEGVPSLDDQSMAQLQAFADRGCIVFAPKGRTLPIPDEIMAAKVAEAGVADDDAITNASAAAAAKGKSEED